MYIKIDFTGLVKTIKLGYGGKLHFFFLQLKQKCLLLMLFYCQNFIKAHI